MVREVRVVRAYRRAPVTDLDIDGMTEESSPGLGGLVLEPVSADHALPRRLHKSEPQVMTHDDLRWGQKDGHTFTFMLLAVTYTFSADGKSGDTVTVVVRGLD